MAKELFKLEKGKSNPLPPVKVTKDKSEVIAAQAEIGDSFNVPFAQWQTVKKHLAVKMPKRKFTFSFLKDEKPIPLTKITRIA